MTHKEIRGAMPTARLELAHLAVRDPKASAWAGADGSLRVSPRGDRAASGARGRLRATNRTTRDRAAAALRGRVRAGRGGCQLWTGWVDRDGYGVLSLDGQKVRAHRLAWMLANAATIPAGLVVRHTCDTPACVNPRHLALGTPADNVADREARGRSAAARVTHCPQGHPYAGDNVRVKVRSRPGATGKVRVNRRCVTCTRLARLGGRAA